MRCRWVPVVGILFCLRGYLRDVLYALLQYEEMVFLPMFESQILL